MSIRLSRNVHASPIVCDRPIATLLYKVVSVAQPEEQAVVVGRKNTS